MVILPYGRCNRAKEDRHPATSLELVVESPTAATLFECGTGDGIQTRTFSLGRVLMPPCSAVLHGYWRTQLATGDLDRPGLVARVWPGSLSQSAAWIASSAGWSELPKIRH